MFISHSEISHNSGNTTRMPKRANPVVLLLGPADDTREMLRVVLELWNYTVIEAENVDKSVFLIGDQHPSVVVMDTALPFDDTLETLSRMQQIESIGRTPSVVLSGYSEDIYRKEAWKHGAACFMVKPIDFDILRTYVDTLARQNLASAA